MKLYIKIPILITIALSIFMYLIGAFIAANFNLAEWNPEHRLYIACWDAGICICSFGVSFLIEAVSKIPDPNEKIIHKK